MKTRRKYQPHYQLRAIRKALEKTQKDFAEMLGVYYPYLLAVETGQRAMSKPLARKIGWLVGVSPATLLDPKAKPMSWDDMCKKFVPFSLETYRRHQAQFLSFTLADTQEEVVPTLEGYAKVFHAVLDSAMDMHRLPDALDSFYKFFSTNMQSDGSVGAFHASLQKLYPEDAEAKRAAIALLGRTHIPPRNGNAAIG